MTKKNTKMKIDSANESGYSERPHDDLRYLVFGSLTKN